MSDAGTRRRVRVLDISPEVWRDQPEEVGVYLGRLMERRPADRYVIVVGPPDSGRELCERLWAQGAEYVEPGTEA